MRSALVAVAVLASFNSPAKAQSRPSPCSSCSVIFESANQQQALNTIRFIAASVISTGSTVKVIGHTDTVGSEASNRVLSLRRANAVKDVLIREGVRATAITVIGRGESDLLVSTGDNVPEPQNRRVEICVP